MRRVSDHALHPLCAASPSGDDPFFAPGEIRRSLNVSVDVAVPPLETSYFFMPFATPLNETYHVR